MEIEIIDKGSYKIVELKGSLDLYTALDLKEQIEQMTFKENNNLIFNMKYVDYVDSSGIGALIKISNLIAEKKENFHIANLKSMIERIFKVAGLMSYFSVLTDEELHDKFPH